MKQSPGFLRHEVRDKLVVSTCVLCHRTVASGDRRLLRVAETAHLCPKLEPAAGQSQSYGRESRESK
jgi:hypothetical protein